jgi:Zn-dependent M28 family amino/carboxypeptidase
MFVALGDVLKRTRPNVGVDLLFTDGEDYGQFGPPEVDVLIGSKYFASHLPSPGYKPLYGILWDMIGDKDLRIMRESNSTSWLTDTVWAAAKRLGKREFVSEVTTVEDDHLEFLEAGVPAVDIIDLDYPAWHRAEDTLDKLSATSMQSVGEVVVAALADIAARSTKQ